MTVLREEIVLSDGCCENAVVVSTLSDKSEVRVLTVGNQNYLIFQVVLCHFAETHSFDPK